MMRLAGSSSGLFNVRRLLISQSIACKALSTSLNRAGRDLPEGSPKFWTKSELQQHVEEGQGGSKMSSIASQELRTMLHQVGDVLNRSGGANDERLAMTLLDKHVFTPALSHNLSPEILTL